jgi:hypothetical protein
MAVDAERVAFHAFDSSEFPRRQLSDRTAERFYCHSGLPLARLSLSTAITRHGFTDSSHFFCPRLAIMCRKVSLIAVCHVNAVSLKGIMYYIWTIGS